MGIERQLALQVLNPFEASLYPGVVELAQTAALRRRAGPLGILERVAVGEADLVHQAQRVLEVRGGLGRVADDQVGGDGDAGPRLAQRAITSDRSPGRSGGSSPRARASSRSAPAGAGGGKARAPPRRRGSVRRHEARMRAREADAADARHVGDARIRSAKAMLALHPCPGADGRRRSRSGRAG